MSQDMDFVPVGAILARAQEAVAPAAAEKKDDEGNLWLLLVVDMGFVALLAWGILAIKKKKDAGSGGGSGIASGGTGASTSASAHAKRR